MPSADKKGEAGEVLTLAEIREKFSGDWVAITVTQRDEAGQPLKGIVIAHDVNRTQLRDMLNDVPDCCIFSTKPPLPVMF